MRNRATTRKYQEDYLNINSVLLLVSTNYIKDTVSGMYEAVLHIDCVGFSVLGRVTIIGLTSSSPVGLGLRYPIPRSWIRSILVSIKWNLDLHILSLLQYKRRTLSSVDCDDASHLSYRR